MKMCELCSYFIFLHMEFCIYHVVVLESFSFNISCKVVCSIKPILQAYCVIQKFYEISDDTDTSQKKV